jgi:hypothetical protein
VHGRFFLEINIEIPTVKLASFVFVCFKALIVAYKPKKIKIKGTDLCHKEGLGSKGLNKSNILHHQRLNIRTVLGGNKCFPHQKH